jgi:hypothetical protein
MLQMAIGYCKRLQRELLEYIHMWTIELFGGSLRKAVGQLIVSRHKRMKNERCPIATSKVEDPV